MDILFSPGVFAVHSESDVLFTADEPASEGLQALAEDGDPSALADELMSRTGLLTPLSPGVWAVHSSGGLFQNGEPDAGMGLEDLAEDGDPQPLADALPDLDFVESSGTFTTPDDADDPGPAMPGSSYSFQFAAMPGDRLSFATMFVQSNDLFFAPSADGLALFSDGDPISGDITDEIVLWDAGTEVNAPPGLGEDQAPRQSAPNTGADEDGDVRPVSDAYSYAEPSTLLRVTITHD